MTTPSFDMLRSVVFFYIKSPLRVEEAGLKELIPTTWWPHRSSREVGRPGVGRELAVRACPAYLGIWHQAPETSPAPVPKVLGARGLLCEAVLSKSVPRTPHSLPFSAPV